MSRDEGNIHGGIFQWIMHFFNYNDEDVNPQSGLSDRVFIVFIVRCFAWQNDCLFGRNRVSF